MKTQNQVLLIAMAVVFAIALALTIAIIFISTIQEQAEEPVYPPEWSQPFISNEPPLTLPPASSEETAITVLPSGNGLAFESNRNGTCSLVGIGSCIEQFIIIPKYSPTGDLVISIASRALMGCESATAIQIPESVTSIGAMAFADCKNLVYISVSKYNPSYCDVDGVLYTADGERLLHYPAMHAGSSLYLPKTVIEIADMAFYRCAYLSSIRYEGTAEDWHMIDIGSKNYSLTAASIVFSARVGT